MPVLPTMPSIVITSPSACWPLKVLSRNTGLLERMSLLRRIRPRYIVPQRCGSGAERLSSFCRLSVTLRSQRATSLRRNEAETRGCVRIAYGVMGYGRGHAMPKMAVLPALSREHEITVFASGDAYEVLAPHFNTVDRKSTRLNSSH